MTHLDICNHFRSSGFAPLVDALTNQKNECFDEKGRLLPGVVCVLLGIDRVELMKMFEAAH